MQLGILSKYGFSHCDFQLLFSLVISHEKEHLRICFNVQLVSRM